MNFPKMNNPKDTLQTLSQGKARVRGEDHAVPRKCY